MNRFQALAGCECLLYWGKQNILYFEGEWYIIKIIRYMKVLKKTKPDK